MEKTLESWTELLPDGYPIDLACINSTYKSILVTPVMHDSWLDPWVGEDSPEKMAQPLTVFSLGNPMDRRD